MHMSAAGAAIPALRGRQQPGASLPPGAHELLRPVVETGPWFYAFIGVLFGVVAWGAAAYLTQLRYGLAVTGLRDYFSWGVYITNFIFFIGVSHAGTLISAILRVSGAEWRRPITRMAEVITGVALLIGAPMVIIDMGRPDRLLNLFVHGRLQSPLLWDVIAVITYLVGSITYLYLPMIPDLSECYPALKDRYPVRARIYKALSLGWQGTLEQRHLLERAISIMAIVIMPVAVSVHTVVSYIYSMTLREGWHSSIFGPYYVIGAIYSGIAAIIFAMWLFRKAYRLERYIAPLHFRKLGYLLLTVGLVYLYATFAEYLTMFYGSKVPEERLLGALLTGRFSGVFWSGMAFTFVPVVMVALARWTGVGGIVAAAFLVNIGMWLKRYILTTPTLAHPFLPIQQVPAGWAIYRITWVEWSITAAAVAAFILLYVGFTKLFPIVSIWETREHPGKDGVTR